MHDIGGFALLLIGLLLGAVLLFQFVLPLFLTWAFGTVSFLLFAFLLVRAGRVHPTHLDAYLKPGLAWLLVGAAFGLPAIHGLYLFLGHRGEMWPWIALTNLLVPVALAIRQVVRHVGQKRRYVREGHDIEDMLDRVNGRIAMLEVKTDLLSLAASLREEPEPWERLAGVADDSLESHRQESAEIETRLATVRTDYSDLARLLEHVLEEVRSGAATPHPGVAAAQTRIEALQTPCDEALSAAQGLVAEVLPGSLKPAVT